MEVEGDVDLEREASELVPIGVMSSPKLGNAVRHNITHRKIDVVPVRFEAARCELSSDAWCWIDPRDPGVPTSSLFQKLVDAV